MTRSMVSRSRSLLAIIITLFCIISLTISIFIYLSWHRAQQVYGPPSTNLSNLEGIYLAILLISAENELIQPADPGGIPKPIEVQYGETTSSIIDRLYQNGLINDPSTFRNYLRYSGLDTGIQAGKYSISPAMPPILIANALQDASPTSVSFTILAGWRLEEIAESLSTSGLNFQSDVFLDQAKISNLSFNFVFSDLFPNDATLEGFLFPDTFTFERTIAVDEFIKIILENFERNISTELLQGFNNQGLDVYQAVTLASIVEREAILDNEMSLIASVYYNRLAAGLKLDADPTVQYALGYDDIGKTWWTNPLTLNHLSFISPYNTYMNIGLPPGPIANPGSVALRAVAFPEITTYYYFRASCDGSGTHSFAESFEEHINNACP